MVKDATEGYVLRNAQLQPGQSGLPPGPFVTVGRAAGEAIVQHEIGHNYEAAMRALQGDWTLFIALYEGIIYRVPPTRLIIMDIFDGFLVMRLILFSILISICSLYLNCNSPSPGQQKKLCKRQLITEISIDLSLPGTTEDFLQSVMVLNTLEYVRCIERANKDKPSL